MQSVFPDGYQYEDRGYHDRRGIKGRRKGKGNPKLICIIITIFSLLMFILGLIFKNPYFFIIGIFPAAIYETIRTEGYFTKIASILILIFVVLEILAILGIIQFDLAQLLDQSEAYVAGYYIPLGDIKFVFPVVAVVLSLILLFRTYGIYTKWLSILLVLNSVGLLYVVNKETLLEIIKNFI